MLAFADARTERSGFDYIMKFFAFPAALGLVISLATVTPAFNDNQGQRSPEKLERSMPVDPAATITVCVLSGAIEIRGWDKTEVRVRSDDAALLEFRRIDKVKEKDKEAQSQTPATRVDVIVMDHSDRTGAKGDCQAMAEVQLDVPHASTIQVQTRDGDIYITGVAAAYAGSQNGDITIDRVTRIVEAGSVGGSISLKDSSGRVNLSSAGGSVDASNVRYTSVEDSFEVGTVSGDIHLNNISNSKLSAKTVNGSVSMSGALAKAGEYGFSTLSGDIILSMPANASFQLMAKISDRREIVSDFVLKYADVPDAPTPAPNPQPAPRVAPKTPPAKTQPPAAKGGSTATVVIKPAVVAIPYSLRRINATHGAGDSTISIASFSGTVQLKKM